MVDFDKIVSAAIQTYGKQHQMVVAIEELSELQKELCKTLREIGDVEHIAEEVADCYIVLAQVERMFGIQRLVNDCIYSKVRRLEKNIAEKRGEAE